MPDIDSSPKPDFLSVTETWRDVLFRVEKRLLDCGFPTREAWWLMESILGIPEDGCLENIVPDNQVFRLNELMERRISGEPLQYVLGQWSFRGLDLLVDKRVLIPRPETEILVDHVLCEFDRIASNRPLSKPVFVADLGCGSGAIGLSVAAERLSSQIWCTDLSPDAIEVTKANLANHDTLDARVLLSTGSWFDALPPEMLRKFDIVISNPPYIGNDEDLDTEISDWEPCIALRAGPLGTENINHLIKEASNWLTGDGSLILELPPHFAKQAKNLAQTSGYFNVRIHHDLTGRERILVARRSA